MMYLKPASSAFCFLSLAVLALGSAAAQGQANPPAAQARNQAQVSQVSESETDLGFNFYRTMNSSTTANGVIQTPDDSYGGMFEFRHIHSPWIGYELTYSYHPADEGFASTPPPDCGLHCATQPVQLTSKASLVGLDWVVSKRFGNLRPFAAGGLGFFIDEPGSSTYGINDIVRISYLYGGGVDFSISDHLGLRAQYRGVVYRAPNLSQLFPSQGIYTQTGEPMGGVFYRF